MIGDKPSVQARDAQQAAAVAAKVAECATKATDAANALPPSDTKKTILKVLSGVGVVAGAVVTGITAGIPTAIIGGALALISVIAAWNHPTPQAVAAFGSAAK
jgi:hypothetical protein